MAGAARALDSVLEAGLTITSITMGGVLGVFLLGLTRWRLGEGAVAAALLGGVSVSLAAQQLTSLAWTWLTPLGASVAFLIGAAAQQLAGGRSDAD